MTTKPATSRTAAHLTLIAVFVVTMLVPLGGLLRSSSAVAGMEKRERAPAPGWPKSLKDWQRFPARCEKYLNDRFAFREELIALHNRLYVSMLGTSPKPAVLLGRDGWLFFNSREVEGTDSLADLAGTPLTDAQLAAWTRELESYRTALANRGIKLLVAVAPNKEGLYPEHLPAGIRPAAGPVALDQWLAAMRASTQVPLLDLRPALKAHPQRATLYARTDTHWNSAGAAVAWSAIAGHLRAQDIAVRIAETKIDPVREATPGGDLAQMLGLPDMVREPPHDEVRPAGPRARLERAVDPHLQLKTYLQDDPALPAALVLRDSFSEALEPFLAEGFRRLDLHWGLGLDEEHLTRHRPDVVLLICAERNLRADPAKFRRNRYP